MWGDNIVIWFAFPWWLVVLNIFPCAYWPPVHFLWKNVYSDPLPIFNQMVSLLLSCMSSFFILVSNSLSDISFANIFFHSVDCIFTLLMISFTVWKDFWFDVAYLFIFAYVSIASGIISQILYTDPNLYIHKHMCVMYIYNLTT